MEELQTTLVFLALYSVASVPLTSLVFGSVADLPLLLLVGPIVTRLGERRTLTVGLLLTAIGWGGSAATWSVPLFVLMLVPGAIGIGLCNATLSALISHAAGRGEQGRVQGAAGAAELPLDRAGALPPRRRDERVSGDGRLRRIGGERLRRERGDVVGAEDGHGAVREGHVDQRLVAQALVELACPPPGPDRAGSGSQPAVRAW